MSKKRHKFAPWTPSGSAIAAGGQGEIFLVTHEDGIPPGEHVLKWLKNPKRQKRFEQEIKSLLAVKGHPNIVTIIDPGAYVDETLRYYVMEKGDGSLADCVTSDGFPPQRAFQIFRDALSGIKALHDAGIIHRDIKPENIIIFGLVAKVGDTGLCLIIEDPRLTPTSEAVGPRYYMAPELEHGRNLSVDSRADLYSLGKVLYWLLSRGVTLPRERFSEQEYNLASTLAPGLRAFDLVFDRTLTTNARSRYASVDKLIAAFDAAVAEYDRCADTRLERKLAQARAFDTAFLALDRDEKIALIKRAELGLLPLSAEDLISIATLDPLCRTQSLVSLLAKRISSTDNRVRDLATVFAQTDGGIDALRDNFDAKDFTRAMLEAILVHGDDAAVDRLVSRPASPWVHFEDLIPIVLLRFAPPKSLPSKLVTTMAAFPKLRDHPNIVEVMMRVLDDHGADVEATSLALFVLVQKNDPNGSAAVDRFITRKKTKSEEIRSIIEPLSMGVYGLEKLRILASDSSLSEFDRGLFELAVKVGEEVHDAR